MFTEVLAPFFDPTTGFAVTASFGIGSSVTGIFDNAFVDVEGVSSRQPEFTCATVDVAALAVDAQLTIAGTAYYVRVKQPDESGVVSKLILEKVS